MPASAHVGVTGLAVMGRNLARNLARNGFAVAVHNRTLARTESLVEECKGEGTFLPARDLPGFVAALERPRKIIIMVKAGGPTDAVIEELVPLLEPGDIVVDGGNAHFADTRRREAALRQRHLNFVGAGISGGEEGALNGPSIMPGGSIEAYAALAPMLEAIAAKAPDGTPTVAHIGPDGAGHFVKMVHNGIEYADMQLIAEAYDLLRSVAGYEPRHIAQIIRKWRVGRLDSYLIEITAEVLDHADPATGAPLVDLIVDAAEQKGTGRWTVQVALDLGTPVSGIAEAVFSRAISGHRDLRQAAASLPGPARSTLAASEADHFADQVEQALYASKIIAYAQGWHLLTTASQEYGWNLDLGEIAAIWRAGSIVRAAFLDRITAAYAAAPDLPTLLADRSFAKELGDAQSDWRSVVALAAAQGIPAPGFSAALAYYDALRAPRLPAALLQAQRDYFGAHTYRRIDRTGTFHTLWAGDRSEQQS
ncbi:MAG: NADP-dependent phosphogluconate dehydrogenase [Micromonosporaceae bacterium]|nr:NADP-dependent phosphogluconate dehydrogenase [Micromonosporaceae bacterium]